MDYELQKHIRHGEFTFCGRCGTICRQGDKDFMCTDCRRDFFSKPNETKAERDEDMIHIRYEGELSAILVEYRRVLAEHRMNSKR
jgi:hypothetical protein